MPSYYDAPLWDQDKTSLRNEHRFNPSTSRCDMSHMAPSYVVDQPTLHLAESYEVRCLVNHRSILAGRVTPARDEHGNPRFYATSAILPEKEMMGWAKGAVEFWLTCIALVHAH